MEAASTDRPLGTDISGPGNGLYPRKVKGRFQNQRRMAAWFLFCLYIILPWLSFRNVPLFQIDIYGRKIILLGNYFWPQDIGVFLPLFIAFVLGVFLVTALLGRIWCGWLPQAP